ncbi:DUF2304 domain-containing protein [Oceanidesulfovibrio indonesiensis]|uniref:DUF2304 domain-containing protein n=1 Tax=Oceanidesulfovibrio indonesiensis TaxID=54767 RepID=A0A7M3MB46_9BACT|nr:DUF2304 domain-containing protein [Oceanidesulfovibrio indonesiensis]
MSNYHVFSLVLGIIISGLILALVRKDVLYKRYAVSWLSVAVLVIAFGAFPRLSDYLAQFLNISYPPTLVMILGICFLLVKCLLGDIERTRHENMIRQLARKVALDEAKSEYSKKFE